MTGRTLVAGLLGLALTVAACGTPGPSPTPAPSAGPSEASPTPALTERPFEAAAWPADGSACALEGYTGLLGRVEAVAARTVRFTLCRPDAAFLARLAHPALGVLDASQVDLGESDPDSLRGATGAGDFRVAGWSADDGIRLERVGGPGDAPSPVILRWAAASGARSAALREGTVDGIDDVDETDVAVMDTLPEIEVRARPSLATAYLGFGADEAFDRTPVRRAFAQALDHAALARTAFPPGSDAATHVAPCAVTGGCAGLSWHEYNGPAALAALKLADYDLGATLRLHVPDAPVPGLPDPLGAGRAVVAGLAESLGIAVDLREDPASELAASIAAGDVRGLYLWGLESPLADASGFLEPLLDDTTGSLVATRAKGARRALAEAAGLLAPGPRVDAFAAANDAIRASAPIVPLVHPGSATAHLADVEGVAVSPLGLDPLGDLRPGDRRQVVVMAAGEPAAAWCAIAPDADSLRLCGLVTPGLYAFEGGGLDAQPALAQRCTPAADLLTWTCRLRDEVRFANGMRLDAGDVLASIRAQADAEGPLRAALPAERFAAWDALFGGPVPVRP